MESYDVTSDSFQVWRAKQSLAPNTVNEYLTSITSLLNWMEKHERIERSPLRHVEKVQTNGKQARPRRAFTRDEIPRLLAAGNCLKHPAFDHLIADALESRTILSTSAPASPVATRPRPRGVALFVIRTRTRKNSTERLKG